MTLFDGSSGIIGSIGGDADTHRRLVDLGLIGAAVVVKARSKTSVLASFGDFRASVGRDTAKQIVFSEGENENRAMRQSQRR